MIQPIRSKLRLSQYTKPLRHHSALKQFTRYYLSDLIATISGSEFEKQKPTLSLAYPLLC